MNNWFPSYNNKAYILESPENFILHAPKHGFSSCRILSEQRGILPPQIFNIEQAVAELEKGKIHLSTLSNFLVEVLQKLDTNRKMWIFLRDPYKARLSGLAQALLREDTYSFKFEQYPDSAITSRDSIRGFEKSEHLKPILNNILQNTLEYYTNDPHYYQLYLANVYSLLKLLPKKYLGNIVILNLDEYSKDIQTEQKLEELFIMPLSEDRHTSREVTKHTNISIYQELSRYILSPGTSPYYNPQTVLLIATEQIIYKNLKREFNSLFF